jgi:hypothetical protein
VLRSTGVPLSWQRPPQAHDTRRSARRTYPADAHPGARERVFWAVAKVVRRPVDGALSRCILNDVNDSTCN